MDIHSLSLYVVFVKIMGDLSVYVNRTSNVEFNNIFLCKLYKSYYLKMKHLILFQYDFIKS